MYDILLIVISFTIGSYGTNLWCNRRDRICEEREMESRRRKQRSDEKARTFRLLNAYCHLQRDKCDSKEKKQIEAFLAAICEEEDVREFAEHDSRMKSFIKRHFTKATI